MYIKSNAYASPMWISLSPASHISMVGNDKEGYYVTVDGNVIWGGPLVTASEASAKADAVAKDLFGQEYKI